MNKNLQIFKTLLMLLAIMTFWVEALSAQEISEDELVVAFANCMTGCRDFESQTGCEILCGCTVERFRAVLKEPEYETLLSEMEEDTLSVENRAFLDETAFLCVAEMDNYMEEYGLEAPPDGPVLPPPEDNDGEGGGGS